MRNIAVVLCLSSMSLALVSSCTNVAGPALTVEVLSQSLVPTASATQTGPQFGEPVNPPAICCCRVKGEVRNTSSLTVHVELTWQLSQQALATRGSIGQARDFLRDLKPGEMRSFDAAGIFEACNKVAFSDLDRIVTPFGLFNP